MSPEPDTSSGSAWPGTGRASDLPAPPYQWSLKTKHEEDKEYLTRLEARLKQMQQPDPKMRDTRPQNGSPTMEDTAETSDDENSSNNTTDSEHSRHPPPVDDDPGIHLLYDHTSETPPKANSSPLPSAQPAHVVVMDPPDPADPTAIIPPDPNNNPEPEPECEPPREQGHERPPRSKLVHFRSRVRIASTHGRNDAFPSSRSSSISASSSLSAPLRGPTEESILSHGAARRMFGVGPVSAAHAAGSGIRPGESLSEMMSTEAASMWLNRGNRGAKRGGRPRRGRGRVASEEANRDPDVDIEDEFDERSPFGRQPQVCYTATPQMTTAIAREIDVDAELDRARRAARKTEEDVIFGPWPRRLKNWNVSTSFIGSNTA
ncbi:hypothetical protein FRC09_012585 [Ceratobasidium sp. 395]|nr:hypothetical protein FRC09_012585 [Ceratobasidium sp. 395]